MLRWEVKWVSLTLPIRHVLFMKEKFMINRSDKARNATKQQNFTTNLSSERENRCFDEFYWYCIDFTWTENRKYILGLKERKYFSVMIFDFINHLQALNFISFERCIYFSPSNIFSLCLAHFSSYFCTRTMLLTQYMYIQHISLIVSDISCSLWK